MNFLDSDRIPSYDFIKFHNEDLSPRDASSTSASSNDSFAESSRPEHGAHFGAFDDSEDILISVNEISIPRLLSGSLENCILCSANAKSIAKLVQGEIRNRMRG